MSGIHIISASAGTGKTTRLAQELTQALVRREARPEAILATTFTRKAAAELQERARGALIEAGRPEDAQRLGAARIGTVNSVCGALVQDYAFDLGLSPDMQVIDEPVAARMLKEALSEDLSVDDARLVQELAKRLESFRRSDDGEGWQEEIRRIVVLARANGLDARALEESAEKSIAGILQLFPPLGDAALLDGDLLAALEQFDRDWEAAGDTTKTGGDSAVIVRRALVELRRGELPWARWFSLQNLGVSKKCRPALALANTVAVAAARDLEHPQFRADMAAHVRLVFRLAAKALETYAERKRLAGVLDFVDQEVLALQLLARPDVQERLRDELDLALVDEFQDTSPLQLAIFLALADLAKKSVWVGDQKQAIYGFRGTDPALMGTALRELERPSDAALVDRTVAELLRSGRTEALTQSWRSRPELVRLTSDVFAKAFDSHGMPEQLVRIEPGRPDEPAALGPVVEQWPLVIPNGARTTDYPAALASAVQRLLADPTVRVRDRVTGEARPLRPGDVALLARSHKNCQALARELQARGIRSVLAQTGLMLTLEGRVLLAALRTWAAPNDRLARAELSRILDGSTDEERWFTELLRRIPPLPKEGEERKALPPPETPDGLAARILERIAQRRTARREAGAVEAVEQCLEALDLRELALEWGDSRRRIANLDAIRALAVRWADTRTAEGRASTPEGLVAHMDEVAGTEDPQGVDADDHAVNIATWHASKGLEWPITVLLTTEKLRERVPWGASITSDGQFQLARPLDGRWIRFWPTPYAGSTTKAALLQAMKASPEVQPRLEEERREQLRLLYVGWTRARDRLVLAGSNASFLKGSLEALVLPDTTHVLAEPAEVATWAGRRVEPHRRDGSISAPSPTAPIAEPGATPVGARIHAPARVQPSKVEGAGRVTTKHQIGPRFKERRQVERDALGQAVHSFFAADVPGLADVERQEIATRQLVAWGVEGALLPENLLDASARLTGFVERRWPGAIWHREWPLSQRLPTGSLLTGTADLVLELPDGLVVVDHKTFPGRDEDAPGKAASYAGQLSAYAEALVAATGKPVLALAVHMPVLGIVCEIERVAEVRAA